MLAHQGGRVLRAASQCLEYFGGGRRIAESDRDVAQPSLVADAADGAALRAIPEIRLAPRKELDQLRAVEAVPRREIPLRGGTRELVPRTDHLTVVAAVDAVADRGAKLERYRSGQFDGEIGDAASRIEPIGSDDGAGRAGRHAGGAASTVRARRLIGRQVQIQVNLAQEEVRS